MNGNFYYLLYTALLANCPRDTGNMVSNITLEDMGDYWNINISGPTDTYDYARAVNYNPQRTPKEARNYMWVEKTIRQVAEVLGEEVNYELS
jgi:hypothetical protein